MNLSNTQFVFDGKLKRNLFIGMGIGALSLVLSALDDDQFHTRFWSNFLHNSVFFTGISFMAMFFLSAQITAFGGWISVVRRLWEAMSQFMLVGLLLIGVIVVGVWGHFHHLYHWNTPGITDPANRFTIKYWPGRRVFSTLPSLPLPPWAFWPFGTIGPKTCARRPSPRTPRRTNPLTTTNVSANGLPPDLPLWGFLYSVFIWFITMSIDSHWYSTMFAWYSLASLFGHAVRPRS